MPKKKTFLKHIKFCTRVRLSIIFIAKTKSGQKGTIFLYNFWANKIYQTHFGTNLTKNTASVSKFRGEINSCDILSYPPPFT